jgi:hypothetical protein
MSKTKMRETDRLIRNIAICTMCPDETLKSAEMNVRRRLHLSSLQNHKPIVVILREMWQELKKGKPHRTLNQMIKEDRINVHGFNDFDRKKAILKTFQTRAKKWNATREAAKEQGLI